MSDLFEAREKMEKGAEWRGTINVPIDGESYQFAVRQLVDTEMWEVMSQIDTDELQELQSDLPEDKMEEYRELQEKDSLTDSESDRLDELQTEVEEEDIDLFDTLSFGTFKGLKTAAEYGIEPDESDIQTALAEHADDIESEYGGLGRDEAVNYLNDHFVTQMVENATNFASFAMGVQALGETLGDAGN